MFWIFAGGTGGHISPGISIAESMASKNMEIRFFTAKKDIEYKDFKSFKKKSNIKIIAYPVSKIPNGIRSLLDFLKNLFLAFRQLNREKKLQAPKAIIAMGGYPCFNGLFWARLQAVPYFICESNAVLGRITRIFAHRSQAVFLSFRVKAMKKNFVFSGNPIRKEFTFEKKENVKHPDFVKKIFLMGGSQGARDINSLYLKMITSPFFAKMRFTLAAGKGNDREIRLRSKTYKRPQDKIFAFVEDMKSALNDADLVIARAGSSSLYEILSVRKPAILIPFPEAVFDHQRKNALVLEKKGLAKMVDIRPFNAAKASIEIEDFLKHDSFKKMQLNMMRHKMPLDAHEGIANHIIKSASL